MELTSDVNQCSCRCGGIQNKVGNVSDDEGRPVYCVNQENLIIVSLLDICCGLCVVVCGGLCADWLLQNGF